MSIARRSPGPSGPNSAAPLTVPEAGYWVGLPDLVSFLSGLTWPDGSARQSGTIMLMTEVGVWKCWLHDRDAGMGCFVSGKTLDSCLERAEEAVGSSEADWRPDRKPASKRS
jgi:hypothetical protein